jgi:hypothetical protein
MVTDGAYRRGVEDGPGPATTTAVRRPSFGVPDRAWVPALGALVLALAFVGILLAKGDGDPSLLVHAGPPWTTADGARGSLTRQPADEAFDGQFFYRLGIAPWSTEAREGGVRMDLPALRNARWGYGALAFLGSGGDPDVVPWSLIGLNVLAATAVGAIGGGLARAGGRHAAWGLLFVLWPGFAYSLSLDTSELVASAFLLGGLLLLRRRQWVFAGLAFAAAVITRDTTAVVPFGVLGTGAYVLAKSRRSTTDTDPSTHAAGEPDGGRDLGIGLLVAGWTALMDFAIWQVVQRARFGRLPLTSSGDNNLTAPLGGLVKELGHVLPPSGGAEAFRLLSIAGLVALLALAGTLWARSAAPLHERVAWVFAVGVIVVLNAYLWSGATAFMRAATEAGLLSILVILGSRRERLVALAAIGLSGLWLLTAASQVAKLG